MESDEYTPVAQSLKRKRNATHKEKEGELPANALPEILVSEFDYSVESHFKFVDTVAKLCGYPEALEANQAETKRFSDSITFLREWRDFNYKPRDVKFACQRNSEEKDVIGGVKLSQFSAASVPKVKATQSESEIGEESSKDFVMNVGGAVMALDWCPRIDGDDGSCVKSEFVAVAAHPPDSSYHKIGAPLTGRGAIQIWCVLTVCVKDGPPQGIKGKKRPNSQKKKTIISNELTKVARPRGRPRKKPFTDSAEKIDPDYEHTLAKVPAPRPRGRPRKKSLSESTETVDTDNVHAQPLAIEYLTGSPECKSSKVPVPRPRGRPRKKSLSEPIEAVDTDNVHAQPLAIEYPAVSPECNSSKVPVPRPRGRPRKKSLSESVETVDADNAHARLLDIEYPTVSPECNSSDWPSGNGSKHVNGEDSVRLDENSRGRVNKPEEGKEDQIQNNDLHFLRKCDHGESSPLKPARINFDSLSPDKNVTCTSSSEVDTSEKSIPVDVALPRMMFCLAHNGKVAWDVKWRPVDAYHLESNCVMGYLAVILGNGALEVWEVPLPRTVQLVYPASQEGTDPRFIKLHPVFRGSMLKCGDRRSIPLTVEWSVSSPHDMILAGCHDGVVALWKFSVSVSLTETRPLLCFSADSGPIRSLSWAPKCDPESANIIVTAGHKGFKFWDIRDPFRPLWDHPFSVTTYSVEWLPDPRCIFGLTEDGIMWLLSLEKAAPDLPVSKKCHQLASKHGFHQFDCSTFSLWNLQASRLTGMVAYCGEEGSTLCFQPTSRLLNDPSRNRGHHYLCGSLLEEGNAIIVASPLPNSSFQSRFPGMKRTGAGKEQEKRAKEGKSEDEVKGEEFESFPPKMVAMHRVRWNVNKGREKWICYGGAAGLLRCQELDIASLK